MLRTRSLPARLLGTAAVTVVALAAGGLAACGPRGGTVRVTTQAPFVEQVAFLAAPGKDNVVTMTPDGADVIVHDAGDTLTASDGCASVDAHTARCTVPGFAQVSMALGDGNDTGTNATGRPSSLGAAGLGGGPGDDVLVGDASGDVLVGGEGQDELDGGDGNDQLVEGSTAASTDVLDGDTFHGGPGVDVVSYLHATAGVHLSPGGAADGRSTEGDDVRDDVEDLEGGAGNDTMLGNAGDNTLVGNGGVDTLVGGAGADELRGGVGDDLLLEALATDPVGTDTLDGDTFVGGPDIDTASWVGAQASVQVDFDGVADDGRPSEGDDVEVDVEGATGGAAGDTLFGDPDDNVLTGGRGPDFLLGNEGEDELVGGDGNDIMAEGFGAPAVDGLDDDRFQGGGGTDTVNYSGASVAVRVDLDDVADDGRPTEGDDVRSDVERVSGGEAGDTLVGDGDANQLRGNGGPDQLSGGEGPDLLQGGSGVDALDGGPQTDDCDVGIDGGTEVNCEV